ncbi:hypothetical protein [Gelidibacter sp. F63206]|uniref:hypothetical protein n=1 Tax=Gelidibacter sp. F63206 TaxID=2926425 RepID=UPI001FF531B0|nr:hypothetical protein [Gelidibacter sp. F63206]MCK0115133.1 hypothetical protein [Gelidibacter sp. F63206]
MAESTDETLKDTIAEEKMNFWVQMRLPRKTTLKTINSTAINFKEILVNDRMIANSYKLQL